MKKVLLISTMLLLLTGCNEEEVEQIEQQIEVEPRKEARLEVEIEPQNATIYYDPSSTNNCACIFKTEYNQYYATPKLDEEFRKNNLRVKVSFIITNKTLDCGSSGPLPLVKIAAIERIERQIDFIEIGKGSLYGNGREGIESSNLVITNQRDWENLMTKMNSYNSNATDNFTETDIDFSANVIIAIFLEVKLNGWEVEISNIEENTSNIVVSITETEYLTLGITQPFHIVKIPKTDKQIAFENIEPQNDLITENATIYKYHDPIFGGSYCFFVIETKNNEIFVPVPSTGVNLYRFTSSNPTSVNITYRLTTDKLDSCYHKDGFLDPDPAIIEIIAIEKI